jgi:FkbM family methyltransferase
MRGSKVLRRVSPRLWVRLSWWRRARAGDVQLQVIERVVRRGDVVFDIGASRCFFAERFVQLVGRHGLVRAFEPNHERRPDLDALRRGRRNVFTHDIALSDETADRRLQIPVIDGRRYAGSASLAPVRERRERYGVQFEGRPVHVEPLDAVVGPDHPRVSFMKIDVEGHELNVLRGGKRTIETSKPVLMIEIEQRHQETSVTEVFDHVLAYGYEGYVVHPNGLRVLETFDVERDQVRFYDGEYRTVIADRGYLNDFLFAPLGWNDRAGVLRAGR